MSEYRQDEHTTAKEASKTHTDQSYRHNSREEHEKRRYSFKEQAIKSMTLFFVVATCILFYFALLRLGQISSVFKQFLTVAKPIIYGLAIAYLLNPIVCLLRSVSLRQYVIWQYFVRSTDFRVIATRNTCSPQASYS